MPLYTLVYILVFERPIYQTSRISSLLKCGAVQWIKGHNYPFIVNDNLMSTQNV